MSTGNSREVRPLPDRPDLRHLRDQARDLLRGGGAATLTAAQREIARQYGFPSWPKLKAHVESLRDVGQLEQAIDANDLGAVQRLMTANPALHRAPLGYGKDGPLTWVAECRVPWEPPSPERLAMARWMIENGSDVHQGGDGPLMRAALNADRIAMMELLVAHGADVDAEWHGNFPILFAPCEALAPEVLRWLLEHGANPNCARPGQPSTALDYLLLAYVRSPALATCIELLLGAGGTSRYQVPALFALLRGRLDLLAAELDADPALLHRRFPDFEFSPTGSRGLTLRGTTLLHVAAEYGATDAARLLLDRGAAVDAPATIDDAGVGGQTPLFHAASQYDDWGLEVTRLLLDRGADLARRATLPGDYERPGELVSANPLEYALRFPGHRGETVALLEARGAQPASPPGGP